MVMTHGLIWASFQEGFGDDGQLQGLTDILCCTAAGVVLHDTAHQ